MGAPGCGESDVGAAAPGAASSIVSTGEGAQASEDSRARPVVPLGPAPGAMSAAALTTRVVTRPATLTAAAVIMTVWHEWWSETSSRDAAPKTQSGQSNT